MKSLFKRIVVAILTWEAKRVLAKYKPKVVAVTGSVGKTSTKDAIYTVLKKSGFVRKSEKSFNSEVGVPLTVLGLPNAWSSLSGWLENILEGLYMLVVKTDYPEWLVLEVGADRPGDIQSLAWLKPQVVLFTRFPEVPVHVEFFGSREAVVEEKRSLKQALTSDGTLIVNADDDAMKDEMVVEGQHRLSYGFSEHATVYAKDYHIVYEDNLPVGVSCVVSFQQTAKQLVLRGALGRHHLYPLVGALTVAVSTGMLFPNAVEALSEHVPPPGRMRLLNGIHSSVLIDDTYNSSPVAVHAAIEALAALNVSGKKIVVLGDMMELGEFSVKEHQRIGVDVAEIADIFVTVGVRMLAAAKAANTTNARCQRIEVLKDAHEAARLLRTIVSDGDVVLVKGSQSMRMERVVEQLLRDPNSAVKTLVRQDSHWKGIR